MHKTHRSAQTAAFKIPAVQPDRAASAPTPTRVNRCRIGAVLVMSHHELRLEQRDVRKMLLHVRHKYGINGLLPEL